MPINVLNGYKPFPNVRPLETDVSRRLNRELAPQEFVTWLNDENEWIISLVERNGFWYDVAMAGNLGRPEITRGTIESIRSMNQADLVCRGPLHQMRSRARDTQREIEEQQAKRDDWLRYLRKKMGWHCHPMLNSNRLRRRGG